jgi:hypothetical protein
LLLMLCLSAWRGPIPCLHAHAAEAPARTHLNEHLRTYHGAEHGGRRYEWHLHLLLPWERFEWVDCADDPEPPYDPLTQEGAVVTPLETAGMIAALSCADLAWQPLVDRERRLPGGPGSLALRRVLAPFCYFAESLLLTAPLRAVTGVALC